jgi:hypothetical protein
MKLTDNILTFVHLADVTVVFSSCNTLCLNVTLAADLNLCFRCAISRNESIDPARWLDPACAFFIAAAYF